MKISYLFKNLAKKINDAKAYTDAQMETGTDYLKFANGVLLQWGTVDVIASANSQDYTDLSFTESFVSVPVVTVSCSTDNPFRQRSTPDNITITGFRARLYNGDSTSVTKTLNWIAIGKWK